MPAVARTNRSSAIRFIKWASGASLILALCQLLLGGDPLIILLCLMSEAVCLVPVYLYGLGRTVGILYLGVWLAFSFSALLAKTILLQPIDSNLFNPLLTFCVTLAGSLAFTIAAVAAYYVKPLRNNVMPVIRDPNILSIVAKILFFLGTTVFVLHIGTDRNSTLSNILIQIAPFSSFGLVCQMSADAVRSRGRRVFTTTSLLMFFALVYVGLSSNSKTGVLTAGLAYILVIFAFRIRLKWPVLIGGFLALAFCSEFLFPAIHIVRADRDRLNPFEISLETIGTVADLLTGDKDTVARRDALSQDSTGGNADLYRNVYFGSSQVWLDRFTNTGFIDAVARRVDFGGPFLGADSVLNQTFDFLPRQLDPAKTILFRTSGGDRVTEAYGLTYRDTFDAPTVPLAIELFSAGGFGMIFAVGAPLIFTFLIFINFFVFDFIDNVWSAVFITAFGMLFYCSTYDVYIFFFTREIPTDYIIMTSLTIIATFMHNRLRNSARFSFVRPLNSRPRTSF